MKRLLPMGAAILLVATVTALIFAWREIGILREEVAAKERADEKRLKKEAGGVDHRMGAGKDQTEKRRDAPTADETKPKKEGGGMALLMGAGKDQIEKHRDARLALLRQRLHLRPDQSAALERKAADYGERVAAAFERMDNNTARPPDMGILLDWMSGRFDLPVKDLLDADQAKQFAGFDAEDRANRIENLVNMELTELHGQGSIQLSPEQKDKVFEALTGILSGEDAQGDGYYTDDAQFTARIDASLAKRREALQPILDASQLENYDRVLADDRAGVLKSFPPGGAAPPGQ